MKQPIQMRKLALLIVALLAAALAISRCNAAETVRMQLTHVDAGRGLNGRELMQRMAPRSKARATRLLLSSTASSPVSPGSYTGIFPVTEYLVHMAISTPPQSVLLALDTGSDLTWTQCRPCAACFDQPLPYFDPSSSSSFDLLPCDSTPCQDLAPVTACVNPKSRPNQTCVYTYSYGDNSVTTGLLDVETFTFGAGTSVSVPGVAFGCGINNSGNFKNNNETGIAGFGRGPLSLPSQLKVGNFSYCFTNITGSKSSTILLNLPADLYSKGHGAVQTTPLIQSPDNPTYYYLLLKGITVGSTRLPVEESTFALRNGTGGTIIDSGSAVTSLPPQVYRLVLDEFAAQVKLPKLTLPLADGLTCFFSPPWAKPDVPKLLLHFEGATMELPRENYVFGFEKTGKSIICLAITEGDEMSIIGNFQQQNMHMLYDLQNSKLSFFPAQCDEL